MPERQKSNDFENVQTRELQLKSKEELLKENETLSKLMKMKSEQFAVFKRFSSFSNKAKKNVFRSKLNPNGKYVLKETFANRKGASSPTSTKTSEFISKVRFYNIPVCCLSKRSHL